MDLHEIDFYSIEYKGGLLVYACWLNGKELNESERDQLQNIFSFESWNKAI